MDASGAGLFTTSRCSSSKRTSSAMGTGRSSVGRSAAGRSTDSLSPSRRTALVNTRRPLTVRPVSVRFSRPIRAVEKPSSPLRRLFTVRPSWARVTTSSSAAITSPPSRI